jgi:hypothetical protein
MMEVMAAERILEAPAARLLSAGESRLLRLDEVEGLFATSALVVDGCRYHVRSSEHIVPLAGRPVLFMLARALAETWPRDLARADLGLRVFRINAADDSLRARLRVEIGRLRKALREVADIEATPRGFVLHPHHARKVVVLDRPVEEAHGAVLALLADGESWPTSALALALATSQRSVQRALDELAASGKVQAYGAGRARRWMTPPLPGIATTLLLPAPLPAE